MAKIIDGKAIALQMQEEMKSEIAALAEKNIVPGLAAILVGDDPASQVYVGSKEKACARVGIYSDVRRLPASTSEDELLGLVEEMNQIDKIHGILVQLPLPGHIDEGKVTLFNFGEPPFNGWPYHFGVFYPFAEAIEWLHEL